MIHLMIVKCFTGNLVSMDRHRKTLVYIHYGKQGREYDGYIYIRMKV